ncbi:MAG TPA: sigma-70 family RNA polymerase sigma factor [Gemmataceae bacterium]|jgi:RNA polymerase sigma factor (sigma-70 family)
MINQMLLQASPTHSSRNPVAGLSGGLTDAQLLDRFLTKHDEAAFELLVWRHGPMVLRVCRRILRDVHGAEDAFQATFLTLACKAGSIGKQEAVSSWLYKVAYRIALRAQAGATKRATHERPMVECLAANGTEPGDEAAWHELGPLLDAEVRRLPEKYRAAFVLCYLEGKTNEEAAQELGCPKGTILSRLSRARDRLRKRLNQRGLALSGMVFPMLLDPKGWSLAAEPPTLVESTVRLAVNLVRNPGTTEGVTAPVAHLMRRAGLAGWRRYWAAISLAIGAALLTTAWAASSYSSGYSAPPREIGAQKTGATPPIGAKEVKAAPPEAAIADGDVPAAPRCH